MVFFVTSAQNVNDIIVDEITKVGGTDINSISGGVEFTGDLKTAYAFCLTSHVATRVLLGLYEEEGIESSDDLYAASSKVPWEEWVNPQLTFSITETVKHADWLRNSHFAAIRLKDAVVDRIRDHFNQERPVVDTDNPDVVFHVHLDGDRVQWYVDFSGRSLYRRGYRLAETEAVLSEYLASAVLYRSDWYKAMRGDGFVPVLFDPFCGSGTLPIEAALYATDTAPGIVNPKRTFAFEKLPIHDAKLWEACKAEAIARSAEGKKKDIRFFAWDVDKEAIRIAKANAKAAGVDQFITFGVQDFTETTEDDVPAQTGYVVTDPPYGVRLDDNDVPYGIMYQKMGDIFSSQYLGWHLSILSGDQRLLSNIDMKPNRTNSFNNGGIPCQLAHYYVFSAEEKAEMTAKAQQRKAERLSQPLSEGAQMAYNRLRKNLETINPLMEQQGVTCYRIYDADMPEYSAAIDLYEHTWICLQEYEAPDSIPEEDASRRLEELIDATERATGIDREKIYVKTRAIQSGRKQYIKFADTSKYYIVNENGAKYLVNFTDYLDTGLFLDHRPIRARIAEMSKGKRFCNLFCYTGSATVQAAKGGAVSTVSVDSSSTYLDWAQQNMRLNRFTTMNHFFYRSDCIQFLHDTWDRYDIIFCDPPTYSNSKSRGSFDIQRDHVDLIKACMMHLDPNGVLIFSTNFRRFKPAPFLYDDWDIQDITSETIGDDFARDPKIHYCFLIRKKLEAKLVKTPVLRVKAVLKSNADKT